MKKAFSIASFLIVLAGISGNFSLGYGAASIEEPQAEREHCKICLEKQYDYENPDSWLSHEGQDFEARQRSDSVTGAVGLVPEAGGSTWWIAPSLPTPETKVVIKNEEIKIFFKCSHVYRGEPATRDLYFLVSDSELKFHGTVGASFILKEEEKLKNDDIKVIYSIEMPEELKDSAAKLLREYLLKLEKF